METNMHPHITRFISSQQMESSETQKRVIALGKTLVAELGLDPGVDTLGRWMAHYVAEQMSLVENAIGEEKSIAEKQCFETILGLWYHHTDYPSGRRPFEDFESIYRILQRLDPENPTPFLYTIQPHDSDEVTSDVQKWLDVALSIDQFARVLIEYAFRQAALNASDEQTLSWLKYAVDLPGSDDVRVITHLLDINLDDENEVVAPIAAKAGRDKIVARIEKLDTFTEFAQALRAVFVDELKTIPSDEQTLDEPKVSVSSGDFEESR